MARYCAYRDRSTFEVENKLKEYRLIPQVHDEILAFLMEENFLDDERFARSLARGKFRMKGWGRRKIMEALRNHRLSEYYIRKGLEELDDEEYQEMITRLIKKKLINIQKNRHPYHIKQKIYRYLLQKGYFPEEFRDILDEEIKRHFGS